MLPPNSSQILYGPSHMDRLEWDTAKGLADSIVEGPSELQEQIAEGETHIYGKRSPRLPPVNTLGNT
jgi:hypothetical protein